MRAIITHKVSICGFECKVVAKGTHDVHRTVRRHPSHRREHDRDIHLPPDILLRERTRQPVEDERQEEAQQPEPLQVLVNRITRKQMLRSDGAPDDRGVVEGLDVVAGKEVGRFSRADALDAAQRPLHGSQLAEARPHCCHKLSREHRSLRHVHVVAELEVLAEVQRLCHGDVSHRLEHHHGDRVSRLQVSDDELREYIQTQLNIGHGLDHADGDQPGHGNDDSEDD